jgi:hypothetical protein
LVGFPWWEPHGGISLFHQRPFAVAEPISDEPSVDFHKRNFSLGAPRRESSWRDLKMFCALARCYWLFSIHDVKIDTFWGYVQAC